MSFFSGEIPNNGDFLISDLLLLHHLAQVFSLTKSGMSSFLISATVIFPLYDLINISKKF